MKEAKAAAKQYGELERKENKKRNAKKIASMVIFIQIFGVGRGQKRKKKKID